MKPTVITEVIPAEFCTCGKIHNVASAPAPVPSPKVVAALAGMRKVRERTERHVASPARRARARKLGYTGPLTRDELARIAAR